MIARDIKEEQGNQVTRGESYVSLGGLLAPCQTGNKDDHGKECVHETEVTIGKRSARANARKHA